MQTGGQLPMGFTQDQANQFQQQKMDWLQRNPMAQVTNNPALVQQALSSGLTTPQEIQQMGAGTLGIFGQRNPNTDYWNKLLGSAQQQTPEQQQAQAAGVTQQAARGGTILSRSLSRKAQLRKLGA
jgi:hypothetical protein